MAGDLLSQFPNVRADATDGFIGSLAHVLTQYPRQVVIDCVNPLKGIARDIKFLSINELVCWLEKKTQPMREDVSREQRVKQQLDERKAWETQVISDGLKAKGQAWLDRTDPIAQQLTSENADKQAAHKAAGLEIMQAANRALFERDCKAAGIDPARGVSPALLKVTGGC